MAMRTEQQDPRPIRRLLRRLVQAPAAWSLIWPIALIVVSYLAFSRWGLGYLNDHYGKVDPELISISPPHEFIRSDVVREVYRDTELDRLSPLDRQATAKLASAFASHAWVRQVRSVRKLPGGKIDVQLEYRRPVAAFHLTGDWEWFETLPYPPTDINDDQYFALDAEGVMLPSSNLTVEEASRMIQIEVWEQYPKGGKGTPFGDRRVESAAMLAGLLTAIQDKIHVAKITVSGDPRINLIPQMELLTGDETRLFWGSPPGMEQPGERSAREKLDVLLTGSFSQDTDLRIARAKQTGSARPID